MNKTIYLIKTLEVEEERFKSLEVEALTSEDAVMNYIDSILNEYEREADKYPEMDIIEDGFESAIFNYDKTTAVLFSVDYMHIDSEAEIPKEIFVYTEVNTYDSGEIYPHALGFLTEPEAKQEMILEINNRSEEDAENYYWISDGDIEEDYVELEDENANISYLECITVNVS